MAIQLTISSFLTSLLWSITRRTTYRKWKCAHHFQFVYIYMRICFPPSCDIEWKGSREGDDFRGATNTPQRFGKWARDANARRGQCGRDARGAEIFGRFTTSVVCRGIEGESLVWHVIGRIYFCGGEAHGKYGRPLSLSAHFFSPSALSFCFLGASPGRLLLPQEFSFLECHYMPMSWSKRWLSHVCSPFSACLHFVSPFPVFVPKTALRAAYTLPFLHYLIFLVTWKVWFGLLGV